jgi:hypothetical protein
MPFKMEATEAEGLENKRGYRTSFGNGGKSAKFSVEI